MKLPENTSLLMIGDSITDAGRTYDAYPNDTVGSLGHGYVALVSALLEARYPAHRIAVHNRGVSGNTVRDLAARWQKDVLDLRPSFLSIMIGTNDVWRQFDSPYGDTAVPPEEFERTLDGLVSKTAPLLVGMALMSPFFLDRSREEPMRQRMDEYGGIVERVAKRHGAIFVDTQAAFDRHLEHLHSYRLSGDRVHPNLTGHVILARSFLEAVDFAW
jgi:lysophospholipase L1-like esterase